MNEYLTHLTKVDEVLTHYVFPFSWKLIGAIGVWVIGNILIRSLQRLSVSALQRRHVDPTLVNYARSTLGLVLRAFLVLAILDIFGIQTTSLSAILAAAGVAIGVAWSGLLSNFAAGIFLIVFRPFRVGHVISAAGVTGEVKEIGLFATTIDNAENVRVFIGNNKLFSDIIINYSTNQYRSVIYKIQLARDVDPFEAIQKLTTELQKMQGVLSEPAVSGNISEFNTLGVMIVMSAFTHQKTYGAVLNSGNRVIFNTLKSSGYPVPENSIAVYQKS